jgi:hypothetical protein
LGLWIGPEHSGDFYAADSRQHQIQNHQIKRLSPGKPDSFFSGIRQDHGIACRNQIIPDEFRDILLIVNHKDPHITQETLPVPRLSRVDSTFQFIADICSEGSDIQSVAIGVEDDSLFNDSFEIVISSFVSVTRTTHILSALVFADFFLSAIFFPISSTE